MSEAIVAENVSKVFRISHDPVRSMKERMVAFGRRKFTDFHALSPMSFTIEQGETIGILGHNGSGKSTLLKCIAGILRPTTGTIAVRGRLASLLELGAGFHPELSGRENVYINAAFLGISRKEIDLRFDEIINFAELGQFIDEPVKHYSSGMYVRLGFAVAVNLDPEVLLVDEVLAVGDEAFAKKCLDRVKMMQAEGRTIVVVTHAADIVRQVCSRALVIDRGHLIADDRPGEAIRIFREHLHGTLADEGKHQAGPLRIRALDLSNHDGHSRVTVTVDADAPMRGVALSIEVGDRGGRMIYRVDNEQLGVPLEFDAGATTFDLDLRSTSLLSGNYPVSVRLTETATSRLLDWSDLQRGIESLRSSVGDGIVDMGAVLQQRSHPSDGASQPIVE